MPQFEREPWLDPIRDDAAFGEALQQARERQARAAAIFRDAGGAALLGVSS